MTSSQPSPEALPSLMLFRDRLQFAMKRSKISQSELGRAIGSTPQNVQHMVRRKGEAYRGSHILQMAEALEVPVGWLACNEPVQGRPRAALEHVELAIPLLSGLSALQIGCLESLAALMRSGKFDNEEVIDLLGTLKPRVAELKSQNS